MAVTLRKCRRSACAAEDALLRLPDLLAVMLEGVTMAMTLKKSAKSLLGKSTWMHRVDKGAEIRRKRYRHVWKSTFGDIGEDLCVDSWTSRISWLA